VEHPSDEELRGLAQPGPVVGEERVVDQLRDAGGRRDRPAIDPRPAQEFPHSAHAGSVSFSGDFVEAQAILDLRPRSPYGRGVRMLVILLATAGGVGYAPLIPGPWGALVAVPFLPLLAHLRGWSVPAYVAVLAAVVTVSIWAAGHAEKVLGDHD